MLCSCVRVFVLCVVCCVLCDMCWFCGCVLCVVCVVCRVSCVVWCVVCGVVCIYLVLCRVSRVVSCVVCRVCMFGVMSCMQDLLAVDALVGKDGTDVIIELNGTAIGLLSSHWLSESHGIRDLAIAKMNRIYIHRSERAPEPEPEPSLTLSATTTETTTTTTANRGGDADLARKYELLMQKHEELKRKHEKLVRGDRHGAAGTASSQHRDYITYLPLVLLLLAGVALVASMFYDVLLR